MEINKNDAIFKENNKNLECFLNEQLVVMKEPNHWV
jgi:hypothetical protein